MHARWLRRLTALALVVALAAPAAWAAPGGVARWELGGVWDVVWSWVGAAGFDKNGPCILPDGKPGPCTPSAAPTPAPGRRPVANKEGGCIVSDGKPVCTPGAVPGQPAAAP